MFYDPRPVNFYPRTPLGLRFIAATTINAEKGQPQNAHEGRQNFETHLVAGWLSLVAFLRLLTLNYDKNQKLNEEEKPGFRFPKSLPPWLLFCVFGPPFGGLAQYSTARGP